MTGKADFSAAEWETISEAPATAGLLVMTAQRGGVFRETLAIAKAYTEARQKHGQSTLLDELVASKPKTDHTRYHSPEELRQAGLGHLRDSIRVLEPKATPTEVSEVKQFIVTVAERVAHAHREAGVDVSPAEQAAIQEITDALGQTSSPPTEGR
ncbi:MAG TPA: hypothetical protein VGI72_06945 [Gaiellales bacterium]|jgi:hypothetical protein